jgi:hypothetical protein
VPIDSITLVTVSPGCLSPETVLAMIPGDELPDGPHGVLSRDLTAGTAAAVPATAPGQMCARGNHPEWGRGAMAVALRIDSVEGELVYGSWRIIYYGFGDWGSGEFTGLERDGLLTLIMQSADGESNGCSEFRLAIPIGATGQWGPAGILHDGGCLSEDDALTFAPVNPGWYYP